MSQPNGPPELNGYGYNAAQTNFRPLNVKDALSYLDQVKIKFQDQPDVYNQFLDIMKDFKSQSIDTPGVIFRVSTLFKGHPELIQGFNTFLPPGFKIEADEHGVLHSIQPDQSMHYMTPIGMPMTQNAIPPHYQQAPSGYPPVDVMAQIPQQPGTPARKTPVEFDHAINYVNKIKTRFQSQPEIYKNFLDILHVYQKEQKSIKEVYEQVAILFQAHGDLLEEFTQFLPEAGATHQQMQAQHQMSAQMMAQMPPLSAPASNENFSQTRPKGPGAGKASTKQQKRGYDEIKTPTPTSSVPPQKKQKQTVPRPQPVFPPGLASSIREVGPELKIKTGDFEEIEYFDRVKKFLGNRHVYAEFLKCLNLFSQEIITRHELVAMMQNFFGSAPELLGWFKKFIGYKEPPTDRIAPIERLPAVDFSKCKRYGPSYRALPKSYTFPACTGRTDLCGEVLNDVWVSFPIWSEDAPFLASKKNTFEETLFRAEDERYDLDRIIEINSATIRTFESVHRKIQGMLPEEAQKFRLTNNLGGTSEVIYHLALKRLYGDKAQEVIEGLKKHPAIALPVVLARLHQKEEEWKKAQREWKKIWADIYAKNLYKSLDYQGIIFKQNDKKNTSQKTLVQEAELLYMEQKEREDGVSSKLTHHYEAFFKDPAIFDDVLRLLTFFVEKTSSGFTNPDKERLYIVIYEFVLPFLFLEKRQRPRAKISFQQNGGEASAEVDSKNTSSDFTEKKADLMDVDSTPVSATASATTIEGSVPPAGKEKEKEKEKELPLWARQNVFFANGALFTLIRLFQFAYTRLETLKELSKKVESHPYRFGKRNPDAEALGLQQPLLHESSFAEYYSAGLGYCEQFLEGKIDQNKFEDIIREMFGIDSYPVYTIDKLIHTIAKQVQFVPEDRSEDLLQLCLKEQDKRSSPDSEYTAKDEATYRSQAEILIGDEVSFEIHYSKESKHLTYQIIPKPSDANGISAVEERWTRYVDNYMRMEPTGKYAPSSVVFLKRNQRAVQLLGDDPQNIEIVNRLECKICINTYRMFFVENSEDYFHRRGSSSTSAQVLRTRKSKKAKLTRFLEGEKGWGRDKSRDPEELAKDCMAFFLGEAKTTQQIEVTDETGAKFCKYITASPRLSSQPASANSSPSKQKKN